MAKEYDITPASGRCDACDRTLEAEEAFVATVRQAGEELMREDFCLACWEARPHEAPDLMGFWRTRVPAPEQKKKRFIDDELIIDFFNRLDGADEPARLDFRFVLALVLMRKRLLVYDRRHNDPAGREVWTFHFKGSDTPVEVVNPKLDEEKIASVSQQIGQIMEAQL